MALCHRNFPRSLGKIRSASLNALTIQCSNKGEKTKGARVLSSLTSEFDLFFWRLIVIVLR